MHAFVDRYYRWFWTGILVLALVIRCYGLDKVPRAPYWEEVALGYDAYSIWQTGRDHHGTWFPIVAFESFGDWKPALYFYAIVPFVAVLGLNVWAVRLPAALSGVALVVGIGRLMAWLSKQSGQSPSVVRCWQLIAMAITTISPWAIMFSRGGWEVNLATTMATWGMVWGLEATGWQRSTEKKLDWKKVVAGMVLLIASMYTYHGLRLTAPLLGVGMVGWWLWFIPKTYWLKKRTLFRLLGCLVAAIILLWPLTSAIMTQQVGQRFAETSIFGDLTLIQDSNNLRELAGDTLFSRIIYHRYVIYAREVAINILSHFNLEFLFISGDANPRHSIQYMGHLYHLEFVAILAGVYWVSRQRRWVGIFLAWWMFVALFPAGLTKATPHALRALPSLPVWIMVITFGVSELTRQISLIGKKFALHQLTHWFIAGWIIFYALELVIFARFYWWVYPRQYGSSWQVGYEDLISQLQIVRLKYPDWLVVVSREYGRPAMYYWFFTKTDPKLVQAADATATKDQGEFLTFDRLTFATGITPTPQTIFATSPEVVTRLAAPGVEIYPLSTVLDQNQQPLWQIYSLRYQ